MAYLEFPPELADMVDNVESKVLATVQVIRSTLRKFRAAILAGKGSSPEAKAARRERCVLRRDLERVVAVAEKANESVKLRAELNALSMPELGELAARYLAAAESFANIIDAAYLALHDESAFAKEQAHG